ncbi:hypothetical protein H4R33_006304 [Dimargaris cristalligena]|nr:hypothetical protein H4R33_006304 [Dimargaris cristalligena]
MASPNPLGDSAPPAENPPRPSSPPPNSGSDVPLPSFLRPGLVLPPLRRFGKPSHIPVQTTKLPDFIESARLADGSAVPKSPSPAVLLVVLLDNPALTPLSDIPRPATEALSKICGSAAYVSDYHPNQKYPSPPKNSRNIPIRTAVPLPLDPPSQPQSLPGFSPEPLSSVQIFGRQIPSSPLLSITEPPEFIPIPVKIPPSPSRGRMPVTPIPPYIPELLLINHRAAELKNSRILPVTRNLLPVYPPVSGHVPIPTVSSLATHHHLIAQTPPTVPTNNTATSTATTTTAVTSTATATATGTSIATPSTSAARPRLSQKPKSHGSFRYYSEMEHIPPDPEEEQRKRDKRREQNKNASKQFRERKKSEMQRQRKFQQEQQARVEFYIQQVVHLQAHIKEIQGRGGGVAQMPLPDEILDNPALLSTLQGPNPPDKVYRNPSTMSMDDVREEIAHLERKNKELRLINAEVDTNSNCLGIYGDV